MHPTLINANKEVVRLRSQLNHKVFLRQANRVVINEPLESISLSAMIIMKNLLVEGTRDH